MDSLAQKGISVAVLDIAEPLSPLRESRTSSASFRLIQTASLAKSAKFLRCDLSRPKEVAEAAANVVQTLGHA